MPFEIANLLNVLPNVIFKAGIFVLFIGAVLIFDVLLRDENQCFVMAWLLGNGLEDREDDVALIKSMVDVHQWQTPSNVRRVHKR